MPFTGTTSTLQKIEDGLVEYNILNQESDIQEVYGQTSSTTTVICEIAYEDTAVFLYHMLGYSEKVGNYLSRICPEQCGRNFNQYAMQAQAVKFLTYTGTEPALNDWPAFTRVQYAVTFGAPLYEVVEDPSPLGAPGADPPWTEASRFVVWKKKGAASNEKIPGGSFKFVDDAVAANRTPLGEVGVRTGRTTSLEAKWIDVPFVNYAGISALANKINDADIIWDGVTYLAQTVLFETWSEEPKRTAFGNRSSDLTFNFLIRQDGRTWNQFWRSDGTFVEVSDDGLSTGNKVFQLGSFENIFKLG